MKRSSLFLGILSAGLVGGLGRDAAAQTNGTWRVSPEPNRRAYEAPPKPREPEFGSSPNQLGGGMGGVGQRVFRQPVAFVMIPAILMSDGTVLANFGMGFEPVRRSCGGTVVVTAPPTVVGSGGRVISRPSSPPGPSRAASPTQPAPQQIRYPILTAASQSACYANDGQGRFFVVRQ